MHTTTRRAIGKGDPLDARSLNRALLARQLLLRRDTMSAAQAIFHLVGMQAQVPLSPYVGLWSRLESFSPDDLVRMFNSRLAVRMVLMRSTLHLVTARDYRALWPVMRSVVQSRLASGFARNITGIDDAAFQAALSALLDDGPRTHAELGALLSRRWPSRDGSSLAYGLRSRVPFVQTPPRGIWGQQSQAKWVPAEAWVGQPPHSRAAPSQMVLRYLKAFGPATIGDIQAWSGLSGLRPLVEKLRPKLRMFQDERGRELFDISGAPLPPATTPAPPRFLPEYDNILLAHADRARIIKLADLRRVGVGKPTLLIDGFVAGTWKAVKDRSAATLCVSTFERLSSQEAIAVREEGSALLRFLAREAGRHDIEITSAAESYPRT